APTGVIEHLGQHPHDGLRHLDRLALATTRHHDDSTLAERARGRISLLYLGLDAHTASSPERTERNQRSECSEESTPSAAISTAGVMPSSTVPSRLVAGRPSGSVRRPVRSGPLPDTREA